MTEDGQRAANWFAGRCRALASDGRLRAESATLLDIAIQAEEPLRVAVAGAVSVGKSELVNALLGRKAAEVDRGEMTSRVTWFRDPGLASPPPLGVAHCLEKAAFPLSQSIVLIDTPGLDTVSGNQRKTGALLNAGHHAAGSAAALIYLVGSSVPELGLKRMRQFAALNSGPFDLRAGIILAGSKADLYETGGHEQGSPESVTRFARNLTDELERNAGYLAGHVTALMPGLAALSRTEAFDRKILEQVEIVAGIPELREACRRGWPLLERTAAAHAPELDTRLLSKLIGSPVGLSRAADLLARERPADPFVALSGLWQEMSGLEGLETVLRDVAAAGQVLTITAVVRRLERLATRVGPHLGAPVVKLLADWRANPARELHDRHAAALVLAGAEMSYLTAEDRQEAVQLLRGAGSPLSGPARARLTLASSAYQVTSRDAQILRIVLDLSLREARPATSQ